MEIQLRLQGNSSRCVGQIKLPTNVEWQDKYWIEKDRDAVHLH